MDASLFTIILLGIIEGMTEFIPVSSTGHLILAAELLGFTGDSSTAFKISIQLGAILAVLVAYWRRFLTVGLGLVALDPQAIAFTRNILIGFLPAMAIGVVAYEAIRVALQTPMLVAIMLVLGGIAILLLDRRLVTPRYESVEAIPVRTAILIGFVQCLAMVPGVSRSGATILGALGMGVERKTAAEFSFFLAVPTMIAATVYAMWKDRDLLGTGDFNAIAIGFSVAFVVALVVVKAFVAIVSRHGFAPFAWYRIAIGLAAIAWLAVR
ncbi:MAG TPA: undecaprenyl-diphosphate phosphatase [Allosphingosinicella sp.]|jgi:undecaprenyl-diphosphatase